MALGEKSPSEAARWSRALRTAAVVLAAVTMPTPVQNHHSRVNELEAYCQ